MARRSGSADHWRRRQTKDPYVQRAAQEGWRSRAVFKLQQIQTKARVLKPGLAVVDLGASPGGWSQYAVSVIGPEGRILAVDREPMEPIAGVDFICGDFTEAGTLEALRSALEGARIGLVMSDMAPDISGNRAVDQPRAVALAEGALDFSSEVLRPGGSFLVKLFQGEGFEAFVTGVRGQFQTVRLIKPAASRPESREMYLLAGNYGMV